MPRERAATSTGEPVTQKLNVRSQHLLCQFWIHKTRTKGAPFQTELLRARSWEWVWNWDRCLLILHRSNEAMQDLPKIQENKKLQKLSRATLKQSHQNFCVGGAEGTFCAPPQLRVYPEYSWMLQGRSFISSICWLTLWWSYPVQVLQNLKSSSINLQLSIYLRFKKPNLFNPSEKPLFLFDNFFFPGLSCSFIVFLEVTNWITVFPIRTDSICSIVLCTLFLGPFLMVSPMLHCLSRVQINCRKVKTVVGQLWTLRFLSWLVWYFISKIIISCAIIIICSEDKIVINEK